MTTSYDVASAVLAQVQDALVAAERPVGQTAVAVGGMIVDDPCAGKLTVAVERVFRSTTPWPTEAITDDECGGNPIGVELLVRVDRCIPVGVTSRGSVPAATATAAEQAHRGLMTDAAVVWNTLAGVAILGDDGFGDVEWVRGSLNQVFVGAEGGGIAVETRVTYGVDSSEWCL